MSWTLSILIKEFQKVNLSKDDGAPLKWGNEWDGYICKVYRQNRLEIGGGVETWKLRYTI